MQLRRKKATPQNLSLSNQNGFCTCFEMNNTDNLLIYGIKYVYMWRKLYFIWYTLPTQGQMPHLHSDWNASYQCTVHLSHDAHTWPGQEVFFLLTDKI